MKASIFISIVICFLTGVTASAEVSTFKKGDHKVIQVLTEGIEVSEVEYGNQKFQKVELKNTAGHEGVLYQPGSPEIPVMRFLVSGHAKVTYEETEAAQMLQNRYLQIAPLQESVVKLPNQDLTKMAVFNSAVYSQDQFLPAEPFTIEEAGSYRGQKQTLVTLHPFSYNPKTGEYLLRRKFEIEFVDSVVAKNLVEAETLAFVVGPQFKDSPSLKKYEQHKAEMGFNTVRVDIESSTTPNDIRAVLKNLYREASLDHVILIGDLEDVPSHIARHMEGVTDHYYSAIDTNDYESDMNSPDVGIGRISVRNEAQLETVLEKNIRYDLGQFEETAWLESISFIATWDPFFYGLIEKTHNYVVKNITKPFGYKGNFPESGVTGGDKLYAITYKASDADVIEHMKKGRSIINYSGHGSIQSWDGPDLKPSDVRKLKNKDHIPFVIANACFTADFRTDESIAETWQRHETGSIAYWGSMDNSFWDEDDLVQKGIFEAIYDKGMRQFGLMTQDALKKNWAYYGGKGRSKYYWETYHLFADPTTRFRVFKD